MLHVILSTALLGAPTDTSSASTDVSQPPAARSFHQLTSDVRAALRAESGARNEPDGWRAVRQLIQLCDELSDDERLDRSPVLRRLRGVVVSRLRRIKRDIDKSNSNQLGDEEPQRIDEISGIVAAQVANVGRAAAPPAALMPIAAVGQTRDFGPDLARLIERTISPDSWDVNGGPSTIVYYAPLRVLVVRAPSEIHGRVGPVLQGLRRAGGN